jgi:hypothetical protein
MDTIQGTERMPQASQVDKLTPANLGSQMRTVNQIQLGKDHRQGIPVHSVKITEYVKNDRESWLLHLESLT